ncbi:MAG: polyphosphate polymerase domain-containing protein [Coriobacteriales bacterium]|nr:polyphosphate polymerase domain-containing protein [Coriobacteriales bacterium]
MQTASALSAPPRVFTQSKPVMLYEPPESRDELARREHATDSNPALSASEQHSPNVFARQEEKYLLDEDTGKRLIAGLGSALIPDDRGSALVSSLYLDTPEHVLIRRSIEKPDYKEKLRVRTYGSVHMGTHKAFLEIKKKFLGIVYKRRVGMSLREARQFIEQGVLPLSLYRDADTQKAVFNRQIMRELEQARFLYGGLEPLLLLTYERQAYEYVSSDGASPLRITFDRRIGFAPGSWEWWEGKETCPLLPADTGVMEIKASNALPLELTRTLAEAGVFPRSFSKIGTAYRQFITNEEGTT